MNTKEINILALAFLGDSVYELYIRDYLLKKGINDVNKLQKETVKYVSAKNQAAIIEKLQKEGFFSSSEMNIIKRGRNNRSSNHPKNCDILTYKYATGLEALVGELYLKKNTNRLEQLFNKIWEEN
ncbi:MAG: ribonuclease III [Tenericutes bacterium]|jgi:ribonuclease-3 family protein|nr:ribonuclease III [Mycoplasmatota bacterium]